MKCSVLHKHAHTLQRFTHSTGVPIGLALGSDALLADWQAARALQIEKPSHDKRIPMS